VGNYLAAAAGDLEVTPGEFVGSRQKKPTFLKKNNLILRKAAIPPRTEVRGTLAGKTDGPRN
jgi:hypothetical protein